jgi:phenylalanine-4-hydroxylase
MPEPVMTSTERAIAKLPMHLRRFVVTQDYEAYTPRDQAVWRHVLRRLTGHLRDKAHASYLRGLEATGIGVDRIPSLDEMNEKLARIGWSAVSVRGFVPPAVFTELQALRVLAIAADIRTFEHIAYTPAPDIIHESAGHAPILVDPRYAEYVQRCGIVGFKSIASQEDQAVYEAIRNLSVVKEDPSSTEDDWRFAEARLTAACASRRFVSESTRASRLYWWTAEYGLVGDLDSPRIYGAGLLSSIGEAERCLGKAVKKLPLTLACADTEYDITTMQPQLFVARDFDHLFEVLEAFESTLAWKRGGDAGLDEAQRARTVNHLVLSDGLELTGRVAQRIPGRSANPNLATALARLEGPIMVSRQGRCESKPWPGEALVAFGRGELPARGAFTLELPSGLCLSGFHAGDQEVIDLRGSLAGAPLELPSWALVFVAEGLPSVAGGPADPGAWDHWYGDQNAFATGEAERIARQRKAEALTPELAALYAEARALREEPAPDPSRVEAFHRQGAKYPEEWLLKAEIDELLAATTTAKGAP